MSSLSAECGVETFWNVCEFKPSSLPRQVNDTVLTDVQGNGQIASASDISPAYPSQRSISIPAGNKCRKKVMDLSCIREFTIHWKEKEENLKNCHETFFTKWIFVGASEADKPR